MFIRLRFGKKTFKNLMFVIVGIVLLIVVVSVMRPKGNSGLQDNNNLMLKLTDEEIKSLHYGAFYQIEEQGIDKAGVTAYNKNLSFNGINIYTSPSMNQIILMDMNGKVLHTWSKQEDLIDYFIARPGNNGNLLLITDYHSLRKLDLESNVIWENKLRFHHDIAIADKGDIYSIVAEVRSIPYQLQSIPFIDDNLIILSYDIKVKKKISLFNLLEDVIRNTTILDEILKETEKIGEVNRDYSFAELWRSQSGKFDIFHANSVDVFPKKTGIFKENDVLVSIRNLNLTVVIDIEDEKIVWSWGENYLSHQHSAKALKNGNILIFDNGDVSRNYSGIIELNPVKKKIVWEYIASPPNSFYSPIGGWCQQLPNGNILITETTRGRAFEIKRNGEIVWEFYNPVIDTEKGREIIYHMDRIDPKQLNPEVLERINWTIN